MTTINVPVLGFVSAVPTYIVIAAIIFWILKKVIGYIVSMIK